MSDERDPRGQDEPDDEALDAAELAALDDDRGMADLVRRALAAPPRGPAADAPAGEAPAPPLPDRDRLVRGIQRRLRERSQGKFYGDGWSVSSARTPLALVALTMLVLAAIVWLALGPTGVTP